MHILVRVHLAIAVMIRLVLVVRLCGLLVERRLEGRAFSARDLAGVSAPQALELKVFAYGFVEQSHCARKPYCARRD
jgi:hypothetical protein